VTLNEDDTCNLMNLKPDSNLQPMVKEKYLTFLLKINEIHKTHICFYLDVLLGPTGQL